MDNIVVFTQEQQIVFNKALSFLKLDLETFILKGIRCVASTTNRQVQVGSDGEKITKFEFHQFRDYPKLSS